MLAGASFLLVRAISAGADRKADVAQTYRSLNEAKQALLGYAATRLDDVGHLPCPDTAYGVPTVGFDPIGSSNTPCGPLGAPSLGLFPFNSVESNDIRDASGASLWYAVSGNHKINPATVPLNSDTAATLSVDGASDIAAVIIAPGPALPGQVRGVDLRC